MLIPSRQRPIPFQARRDLQFRENEASHAAFFVVKDPVTLQYFRVLPVQHRLLKLLDGQITWEQLHSQLQRDFRHVHLPIESVRQLIFELHDQGLVVSCHAGQSLHRESTEARARKWSWSRLPSQLMFIKLPGVHAGRQLQWLANSIGWMLSPLCLCLAVVFILGSWTFLAVHVDSFDRQLQSLMTSLSGQDVLSLWIAIGLAKVIHELAHGTVCRYFGAECHEIGLAFLIFSPCLYCDVSDAWMLTEKHRRIAVSLAGICIELVLSAACIWLWWLTHPGWIHTLALQLILVLSVSTVVFNANPLLRFDGYYVLSDLLDVPNLQQRGQEAIRRTLSLVVFGVRPPQDPFAPQGGQLFLLGYGLASAAYRWIIVFGIGLFLYGVLQPHGLQFLAVTYVMCSGVTLLAAAGTVFWRVMMQASRKSRWTLVRLIPSAGVVVLLGVVLWRTPLSDRVVAPVVVEPFETHKVYANHTGTLVDVFAVPGETVQAGQPIAQLRNEQVESELVQSQGALAQQQTHLAYARAASDPDLLRLTQGEIQVVSHQLETLQKQQQTLTILAPCSGTLMSAALPPGHEDAPEKRHFQSVLDPQRQFSQIDQGTHVCSIAPDTQRWMATAWIQQNHCGELTVGEDVEVKLHAFPDRPLQGTVHSISPAREDHSTSETHTAASPMSQGKQAATYRVSIELAPMHLPCQTGLRGTVRFIRRQQTIGHWLTETFYRNFQFLPAGWPG